MIELPNPDNKAYRAIRQRVTNTVRSLRAANRHDSASYPALAMVQAGISELLRVHNRNDVAALLREMAKTVK